MPRDGYGYLRVCCLLKCSLRTKHKQRLVASLPVPRSVRELVRELRPGSRSRAACFPPCFPRAPPIASGAPPPREPRVHRSRAAPSLDRTADADAGRDPPLRLDPLSPRVATVVTHTNLYRFFTYTVSQNHAMWRFGMSRSGCRFQSGRRSSSSGPDARQPQRDTEASGNKE